MAGGGGGSLEDTPVFAAATVCFVFIVVSIAIEHSIHLIGKWLQNTNRIKLYEALEKIKSELMLLGFISLLLTVSQNGITKICITPQALAESWLPCKDANITRPDPPVCKEGKVQFITQGALHQLHVFIFVLACVHVINCGVTMLFGKIKMKQWRKWEVETKTEEYQSTHNSETPRYTRQTTFVRRHFNCWTTNPFLLPFRCFCKQFYKSVRKVDYLTLRHGFITAYVAPESRANFDFHDYMDKTLEEDFKVVVGISPTIWFAAVISLLFNKYQFHHSLWLPAVPLIVLLAVGTKLQGIITKMAIRIQATSDMVVGDPIVQPRDELFWFNRPAFLLYLINFVLFQNAFQVALYIYTWWMFGANSCFHKEKQDDIIIMGMGLLLLVLCSYVTLPLYALVTMMGATMKPTLSSHDKRGVTHRRSSSVRPDPNPLDEGLGHDQALHHDVNANHTIDIVQVTTPHFLGDRSRSCN